MNNKKTVLAFILTAVMVAGAFAQEYSPESHFKTEAINGGVKITDYTGPGGVVRIPPTIRGLPVVEIGSSAFHGLGDWDNENARFTGRPWTLTSVTIPDSVEKIGELAFVSNQLTSVTIGNKVNYIGRMAFAKNQLTSITIPRSVTVISREAFLDNQLRSVTIVATEGTWRFDPQMSFDGAKMPSGMPNSTIHIGSKAFDNNPITSITLGDDCSLSFNAISEYAFTQSSFVPFYYVQNRKGGTFVLRNGEWQRQ